MLRITTDETGTQTRFRLEGRLKGDWVRELERCWTHARKLGPAQRFCIDLSHVDFVDERGNALLQLMASQAVELVADGNLMMSPLIEEIVNGPKPCHL